MGPCVIFVDGYNIIKNTPSLASADRRDLAAGREALLGRLVSRYRRTPHKLVVVFDGAGPAETCLPIAGYARGQVVFSRQGEKADSVIIRRSAEARREGREVIVISDDLEVRQGAERQGAATARVDELRERMEEAPRLLRKRFTHQEAVRRDLEDRDRDADERAASRKKGAARKAPRKRTHGPWGPSL